MTLNLITKLRRLKVWKKKSLLEGLSLIEKVLTLNNSKQL